MNRSLLIAVVFVLGLLSVSAHAQDISLEKKQLLNKKVEILVPAAFGEMTEELLKLKYPSERRPTMAYTDSSAKTNVAFNYLSTRVAQGQMEAFKQSMVNSFKTSIPTAKWVSSGVKNINGRNVGYLELVTPAVDQEVYNLMFFTDVDGKLFLATFNCLEKERSTWQQTAHRILNSLKVN